MNGSPWYMAVDFGTNEETRNPADYFAEALAEDEYWPGDIVTLLTGSPLMTVLSVCEHGCVEVAWYDDHKGMNIDAYPEEAIVHWDGDE